MTRAGLIQMQREEHSPLSPSRAILIRLFLVVAVTGLLLLAGELLVRLTWQIPYAYPDGLHISDETKGYKYRPYFTGYFRNHLYSDIAIKINSKGLRDDEHSYEKDPASLRIFGLGDSVTFGSGVEFADTYLRQLENKLNSAGYDIEIIKAGVNGYEFDQQYTYFFEEGIKYAPDIVMIGVVLNDARPVDVDALKEKSKNRGRSITRSIIGTYCVLCKFVYSSAYRILRDLYLGIDRSQLYFERVYGLWQGSPWEEYQKKLFELNSYLEGHGIDLVLVIFPYTQQFEKSVNYGREPQNKIKEFAASNNIQVIDLVSHLDLPNFEKYYLAGDSVHLNADGYAIVRDVLYEELIKRGLVAKKVQK